MLPTHKDPTDTEIHTLFVNGLVQLVNVHPTQNKWLFFDNQTRNIYDLGASNLHEFVKIFKQVKSRDFTNFQVLHTLCKGRLETSVTYF